VKKLMFASAMIAGIIVAPLGTDAAPKFRWSGYTTYLVADNNANATK
jgi:hypothetical protein